MKKSISILIGAILIALIAPILAQLPSDALIGNREEIAQPTTPIIVNPMDPNYVWGNPLAVDLNGVNPMVFQNIAFSKDPGGILGSSLYTTSINDFRKDDNSGYSNVPKKAAKVGLISDIVNNPVNASINASINASQNRTQ
ncbi:MAG: hypothetical protein ACXWMH_12415 [Syntrophales bacterium]